MCVCVKQLFYDFFLLFEKNLAWVRRWQTGNSSKWGQKRGKTSKLLRFLFPFSRFRLNGFVYMWAFFSPFIFSSLMCSLTKRVFVHTLNALGLVVWTKMLQHYVNICYTYFFLFIFFIFSLAKTENEKQTTENSKSIWKIHIKGRGLDVCYNKQCFLTLWLPFCSK